MIEGIKTRDDNDDDYGGQNPHKTTNEFIYPENLFALFGLIFGIDCVFVGKGEEKTRVRSHNKSNNIANFE